MASFVLWWRKTWSGSDAGRYGPQEHRDRGVVGSPCKPEGLVWGLREEVVKARTKEDIKGGRGCHEMQGQPLLMDWGRSPSSRPTPKNSKQSGALGLQPATVQNRPSLSLSQQRQWWGAAWRGLQERVRGKAEGLQAWTWALRATLTWHWGKSLCGRTRLRARGLHRKPTQQHLLWQAEMTVVKKHFQIEWKLLLNYLHRMASAGLIFSWSKAVQGLISALSPAGPRLCCGPCWAPVSAHWTLRSS